MAKIRSKSSNCYNCFPALLMWKAEENSDGTEAIFEQVLKSGYKKLKVVKEKYHI